MLTHFLVNLRAHPIETFLLIIASVITLISAVMFYSSYKQSQNEVLATTDQISEIPVTAEKMIYIEISGAIKKPDVYRVPSGTRLYELIDKAGGLSSEADSGYIARNYNMSKLVADQEKIYMPTKDDIANGIFIEPKERVLAYSEEEPSDEQINDQQSTGNDQDLTISLNISTQEELETLPGVGPVTANKIINGRPYSTVDELLSRKIVNSSTFEKIREFIKL